MKHRTLFGVIFIFSVLLHEGLLHKQFLRVCEASAPSQAVTNADDIFSRKVSLTAKAMPLKDALAAVARSAKAELQLDLPALKQAGLDIERPVTVTIQDEPLAEALGGLINWEKQSSVLQLKSLPKLRTLWLRGIESEGFVGLKVLTELRELTLMMGNIREDELAALENALPNARIHHASEDYGFPRVRKK